jgi:TolB protein
VVLLVGLAGVLSPSRPEEEKPATPPLPAGPTLLAPFHEQQGDLLYPCLQENGIQLLLFDLESGNSRKLTNDQEQHLDPRWSPDGARIAFARQHDGRPDIFVMDADGSHVQQLTHGEGNNRSPAWSADGRRIAFTTDRDGHCEVYVMDADGANPTNLTRHPGFSGDPAWSPDDKLIAFVSERDGLPGFRLCVMDSDGKNVRMLTHTDNAHGNVYPDWSPDGTKIAYADTIGGALEIFVCNPDGSNAARLTELNGFSSRPSWSPDGQWIAFHRQNSDNFGSLFMIRAAGGPAIEIFKAAGRIEGRRPAWRPKGRS